MQLELTLEEARVLNDAVDYIIKRKDIAESIFDGDKNEIRTFGGVAGTLRMLYRLEKRSAKGQP